MRNIRSRLESLEEQITSEPIMLLMPGSRTEVLPGHNDYVLNLLWRAIRGDRTPEMELIARSESSTEPGGAHMIDLVRALLNGPNTEPSQDRGTLSPLSADRTARAARGERAGGTPGSLPKNAGRAENTLVRSVKTD